MRQCPVLFPVLLVEACAAGSNSRDNLDVIAGSRIAPARAFAVTRMERVLSELTLPGDL